MDIGRKCDRNRNRSRIQIDRKRVVMRFVTVNILSIASTPNLLNADE